MGMKVESGKREVGNFFWVGRRNRNQEETSFLLLL